MHVDRIKSFRFSYISSRHDSFIFSANNPVFMSITSKISKKTISHRARLLVAMILCAVLLNLPLLGAHSVRAAGGGEAAGSAKFSVLIPAVIDSEINNVELGGGGAYALVAPMGATSWLTGADGAPLVGTDLQRSVAANSLIWSVNTATGAVAGQEVVGYFPSKIAVNQGAGLVAVRHLGMVFDGDGNFVPTASVSILRLAGDGRLALIAISTIPAVGADDEVQPADGSAPDDLFTSKDGRFVFVTNGAAVFAIDAASGAIVARHDVIAPDQYGPENEITSLSFHADSGTFGAISGNSIYVNDNGPDSENPNAQRIDPVDALSFFRFVPPAAATETTPETPAHFTEAKKLFFVGYGISAGSNVEFNSDGGTAFVYAAKVGMLFGVDVQAGLVSTVVQLDLQARDNDDLKSVRTLVYSPQSRTLAIAVTGKRITHPGEYARRITHPGELARRITHPGEFARRITHPGEYGKRRGLFDTTTVSPRVYLIANGGVGNLVPSYSYTSFAWGTTISAPTFGEQGKVGYLASNDGRLFTIDMVRGTLGVNETPGASSASVALDEIASRLALIDSKTEEQPQPEKPAGGSITIMRSLAGSR